MKKFLIKNGYKGLNLLVLLTTIVSANQRCSFIFHEPKKPDGLKSFRVK
ncbi:cyclic lactone autoinducer peptide [Enterococcus sp.]|nr:cyclic lactone autoinducer peptide [Enterococcus sp.]MDU5337103.1 cyclic lactone autoinducer peptide [Enterococcus sp.]